MRQALPEAMRQALLQGMPRPMHVIRIRFWLAFLGWLALKEDVEKFSINRRLKLREPPGHLIEGRKQP